MAALPKKIELAHVSGYVYCEDWDLLPCENDDDKERLLALAEIYQKAVERGAIIKQSNELPKTDALATRNAEREAYTVILNHALLNTGLFEDHQRKIIRNWARSMRQKAFYLTAETAHKITGRK
ncbi:hypothetical protein HYX14_04490 [Candidatus Woesearchaeota archaeon]|nr:hypothetical protein [Candidatus Woesearchaeota archaeon]